MFSCKKVFRSVIILVTTVVLSQNLVLAQSTVFKTGSAIIDMGGAGAPTVNNSLKPYGLIYALLSGYNVPVNGVIGQSKVKDGIDFTYGAKSYKGGTYVISAEMISPDVKALLTSWATQGVLIDYTTSDLTVNVTYKIAFAPKWVMDKTNGNIAVAYLTAAGIPAAAYSFKDPSELGSCDDIFVLPHASPTWNTHNNLFKFNRDYRGAIYVSCSAGSALESLYKDSSDGSRYSMNFLTTTGLVPASTHAAAVTPFVHQFPTEPIAQYIGKTDAAQIKGAEVVYLPKKGGRWNTGTKILTLSPTQSNIPTLSDGPAAINVFGRGFDDPSRGYVFYEAAHSVAGTTAEFIAAQRMFFNFSFFALGDKAANSALSLSLNNVSGTSTVPTQLNGNSVSHPNSYTFVATASTADTYTFQWKSSVPGSFSTPTNTTTTSTVVFTPNDVTSATQAVISCIATASTCSRSAFDSKGTTVIPSVPSLNSAALTLNVKSDCANNAFTFNVFDSVVDVNAGARTLSVTTTPSNGTISVNATSGAVTYTPNSMFQGTETLNYTISNGGVSTPASNTITIYVGKSSTAPKLTNDTYTSILENQLTVLRVLDNDKNNPSSSLKDKLFIREITSRPAKGYVYINSDRTLSYVSKKNTSVADYTESFSYEACNDLGLCSIATVTVSVVDCGCGTDLYKLGISTGGSSGTITLTATADSYIDKNSTSTNYYNASELRLSGSSSRTRVPLFKFDLSTIPTGVTINSAYLKTYLSQTADLSSNNPFPATIYPLKRDWVENGVTWTKFNSTTNWGTSGATSSGTDYVSITSAPTFTSPGTNSSTSAGTLIQSDIKNIVNGWINGTYTNYGLIIFPTSTSSSSSVYLGSKENTNSPVSYKPLLVVSYGGTSYNCISIPTNYKPIVYLDNVTTASNTNLSITPLLNDFNYYTNTNSITSFTQPAHGTASRSSNTITYIPNGSFVGNDTLTYTVTDATNSQTNTATIIIDVTRVAPVINHDEASTPSATPITINVSANDSDPQGSLDVPIITSNPKFGIATISGNSILYTPNAGYVGKDTLVYLRASAAIVGACSLPLSDTALVVITITNRVPLATNDNISASSCKPIEMDLLVNDQDPEGTPLTIYIISNPTHGIITKDANGKYIYTSASNYVGADQFTYKVKDGSTDSLSSTNATVSINVSAASINHAPNAVDDTDNTVVNQDVSTDVIANDSDPDNDGISINITASGLQAPSHGSIQLLGNGQISYMPTANYTGTDTYQYQVCDNNINCSGISGNLCSIATVTITIKALPISISGTVWNDIDKSASGFTTIRNGYEVGSNAFNGLYAHLVDASNNVIDQAPIAYDGTYLFSSAPSNATSLKIVLNNQLFALGSTITIGSIPTGFASTTPLITSTFNTTVSDIAGQDFGINQLPTANSFTFAEQTNPSPSSLTVTSNKFSGSDADGTINGFHFTSFPNSVVSITINSVTYTSSSWPVDGVTVGTASLTVSIVPNAGTVSPTISFKTIDNAGFETTTAASITLPLYIQLTAGTISLNAGTSSTSVTYCGPTVPSAFYSLTSPAGGRGTILYQWEKSTDGSYWVPKTGATSIDYTPTASLDSTTYYRRKSYTSIDLAVYSNTITVTINALPTITAFTNGSRSGTGIVVVDATAGANSTVDWYSLIKAGSLLSSGTVSNTAISYTSPSISTTTIYFAQARDLLTSCLSANRTAVTAEVIGTINGGVISADQALCGTSIPDLIASDVLASGTGTITYQWQSSTTSSLTGFTNITSETGETLQPGTISATTYYRRDVTANSGSGILTSTSNVITVTVNPLPALPIAVNKARTGVGTVLLSASTPTGITVDWYDDNILTNVLATGTNNFTTPELADTTSYYTVARNIATGCSTSTTEVIAIVNEAFNGGIISGPSNVCINSIPALLTSSSLANGGTRDLTGATLGSYTYQWESSTTSTSAGFSAISGAISTTYQSGTLSSTTFFRRKVTTPNDPAAYSNVITINVNALPTISTIINSAICAGSGIVLTTTGAATYSWSPSTGLSATNIASPTASPSTTTVYAVTAIDLNGCSNTASTTITVNALPTITLGSTTSVNSRAISFNLPYTATTGSPSTFNISTTSPNALSGFTAISNASLSSSPIAITIPASAAGTYNFNINVTNTTTSCTSPNVGFTEIITLAPPSGLSYTSPNVYTTGVTITNLNPTVTGTVTNYTISPSLPAGLVINAITGIISGTPNSASPITTYTVTASNTSGSVTANVIITVLNNSVVQPQGGITAVDYKLLTTDSVKIKVNITAGQTPFTVIISNSLNSDIDTVLNVLNGDTLTFKPISSSAKFTITKIIDANSIVRASGFTKDTTKINILKPNIALTLKASAAVKQPDNSFKTTLSLKIKNSGELDLGNVQVNANLSDVFPAGINYRLDSVKVVNGNFRINPNYLGNGSATSPSSINPNKGLVATSGIKSNAVLDANYLFDNGANLAINQEGLVQYYLSIGATTQNVVLKLQFVSTGAGQLTNSNGIVSQQSSIAVSDDGSNLAKHPNNTNSGTPLPTYLPLFPVEKIGTSLSVGAATVVSGGYTFPFVLKIKNYGNLNLDSLVITQNFANTFTAPDNATIVGTPTFTGNLGLNTGFNGYTDTLLVDHNGKLVVGDSATISYTLLVSTNKTSATWLNQFIGSGHSTLDYTLVSDSSTAGSNPDPSGDNDPLESELTRFYINYLPPAPPTVDNKLYLYQSVTPSTISSLVKSYPIGTVPVWCNIATAICATTAPTMPTIIGRYVYQLRSYDTTSKLYSVAYVNDTITIKPPVPLVMDSTYIIGVKNNPLNVGVQVKGMTGSTLNYFYKTVKQNAVPVLGTIAGTLNYTASQIVNSIESDTTSFKVIMLNVIDVIHLQKIAGEAVLQSNSTFNVPFTFVVSNLTNKIMDSVVIVDNLLNSVLSPSTYSVISVTSTGKLIANPVFNGASDQMLSKYTSKLDPFAKDTIHFVMNYVPNGITGILSNTAIVKATTPYGTVSLSSSSNNNTTETNKAPTSYHIPNLEIDIPEGFSPNRDGVNDKFIIIKPSGTILDLEVYNRWGSIVYYSANYNNEWDGKGTNNFIGQDLMDGGYYYTLKAKSMTGTVQIYKGFVIIQR